MGNSLNTLVETIAVMIVTSCLIPIVVLLLFLWLVQAITGLNIGTPSQAVRARPRMRKSAVKG